MHFYSSKWRWWKQNLLEIRIFYILWCQLLNFQHTCNKQLRLDSQFLRCKRGTIWNWREYILLWWSHKCEIVFLMCVRPNLPHLWPKKTQYKTSLSSQIIQTYACLRSFKSSLFHHAGICHWVNLLSFWNLLDIRPDCVMNHESHFFLSFQEKDWNQSWYSPVTASSKITPHVLDASAARGK